MAEIPSGRVVVYEAPDGDVRVDVRLERETVWLTQQQMAELFGRERSVITGHVRDVFRERELAEEGDVRFLHIAGSDKPVGFYHHNVIISVGYRAKSLRGTRFRIWATRTLRDHPLRGYTLNERRLAERGLGELEQTVELLARTLTTHALVTDEGEAVLDGIYFECEDPDCDGKVDPRRSRGQRRTASADGRAGRQGRRRRTPREASGTDTPCPQAGCGGRLAERNGRFGRLLGCTNYPRCRYTENLE